jgi:replicative DNA helicase
MAGPIRELLVETSRNGSDDECADLGRLPSIDPRRLNGAEFVLDGPAEVEPVWGGGDVVAHAKGEPLMLVAPPGVGKTTLALGHCLRRIGIRDDDLLGLPVRMGRGRSLYLACDRPRQIARAAARSLTEADRDALELGLSVWSGPLPFSLGTCEPGTFAEFVTSDPDVDTVYIDSLKDVATKLSDDETGGRVNGEFQRVIAAGVEVVVLHHQRKGNADNRKPKALDDVYGSTWLTSGMGSVVLLWGQAGDPVIEVRTLKPAVGELGPLQVSVNHETGEVIERGSVDLCELASASNGVSAREAAVALYDSDHPTKADVERARRKLLALVRDEQVKKATHGDEVRFVGVPG